MNTLKIAGIVIAGAVIGWLVSVIFGVSLFGGVYNNVKNDFSDGISVDGTTIIDGLGNLLSPDGTFSDDLNVSGDTVVKEFTQGGGCATLTDANGGTYALTEAELLASNCFEFAAGNAGQAVIALTFPATSTWTTLIPNAGDFREWVYSAAALAAATTTTITAGTGMDLIAVTTADDVIDGLEFARISCWRQADTDVTCLTSELLHAD